MVTTMVGSNMMQLKGNIDGFARVSVPCCDGAWFLTDVRTRGGNPVVYHLDPWSRVDDVGYWSIQDGVIVDVPAEDVAELRAIAEVYARC